MAPSLQELARPDESTPQIIKSAMENKPIHVRDPGLYDSSFQRTDLFKDNAVQLCISWSLLLSCT